MKAKFFAGVALAALAFMPLAADAYFIPDPAEPGEHYGAVGVTGEWSWMPEFQFFEGALGLPVEVETVLAYLVFGYVMPEQFFWGRNNRLQFEFSGGHFNGTETKRRIGAGNLAHIDGSATNNFNFSDNNRLKINYKLASFGLDLHSDFVIYDEWGYTSILGVRFSNVRYDFDLRNNFIGGGLGGNNHSLEIKQTTNSVGMMIGGYVTHPVAEGTTAFAGAWVRPMLQISRIRARQDVGGVMLRRNFTDTRVGLGAGIGGGISHKLGPLDIIGKANWTYDTNMPAFREKGGGRGLETHGDHQSSFGLTVTAKWKF